MRLHGPVFTDSKAVKRLRVWARDADSDRLTEVGLQIRAGHVVIDPLPREEEPLPEPPAQAAHIDGRTLAPLDPTDFS